MATTPLKIVVLGATGMAGSRIVGEALDRGHHVTAAARGHADAPAHERLDRLTADVTDTEALAGAVSGADVVVSALPARLVLPLVAPLSERARTEGARIAFVGGAGSLRHPAGGRVIDQPGFREEWKPEASAHVELLDLLRTLPEDLDWTFLSPSALFLPGERTEAFRLGGDDLLTDAEGGSRISAEDYAIALLDEIETPAHRRRRFTVGY
ncbi:NAD(P)-dependent oxidoreductase [Streptomyces sp. NPDC059070]|uniref:NAD(P)-dependent oxidoreductase n=1 Tax=Streptomyces sp. NPDC059070 TaxID=3346713 RepID=UPI0036AB8EC1